jgi:hypothetical protein
MDYEDDDEVDGGGNGTPAADPVVIAFTLIDLALNPKAAKAGLKQLVKLDKSIAAAEQKLAALTAQAEQTTVALAQREAAVVAREAALDARETAFTSSLEDAHSELREHHGRVEQAHRQLVHRVMSTSGILSGWNPDLQDLPTWEQLRRQIADLPPDPPALVTAPIMRIDALSDTFSDPNADRHGNAFLGTLSRDVSHQRGTA